MFAFSEEIMMMQRIGRWSTLLQTFSRPLPGSGMFVVCPLPLMSLRRYGALEQLKVKGH